jgi:hypothetical protein
MVILMFVGTLIVRDEVTDLVRLETGLTSLRYGVKIAKSRHVREYPVFSDEEREDLSRKKWNLRQRYRNYQIAWMEKDAVRFLQVRGQDGGQVLRPEMRVIRGSLATILRPHARVPVSLPGPVGSFDSDWAKYPFVCWRQLAMW